MFSSHNRCVDTFKSSAGNLTPVLAESCPNCWCTGIDNLSSETNHQPTRTGENMTDNNPAAAPRGMWSSRLAFILAATGSAVGLGNIWKFPYVTGENGGGAFVLVYLLCIAIIGIPIMMASSCF